jgi:hypothetical protein
MKTLFIILILLAIPLTALSYDYQDENIQLTITNTNWELTLDNITYSFKRFGNFMKVSGGDVCYWLYQEGDNLMQADCNLQSISILIANI